MNSSILNKSIIHLTTMSVVMALTMVACATMRKDTAPLPQIQADQIRLASDIKLAREGWPQAQWWRRFGDGQLDTLMEKALKDAPVMAVAKARVEASRSQASLVEANSGLLVGFTASLDRQHVSENGYLGPFAHNAPSMGMTGPWYSQGNLGLKGVYEVDLWGKDRARVDAALGVNHARQAELAQAELVLSAQVAHTYFGVQSLYATLNLLEQARDIENEMVSAHLARAKRGLEPHTHSEIALAHKLELEKQISALNSRVSVLREALRSLTGSGPVDLPPIRPVPLPQGAGGIPASLGFDLLSRRPDLQAMRWYTQASLRQVDAAKAAFYPSFDIKAFFGFDSLHLEDLLNKSSKQMNLIPGLSLPIFDSGRLNAGLASARAQSNLMIAEYNGSVLNAVREVAQIGIELQGLNQQASIQEAKLKAVSFSMESAEAHYKRGLADKVTAGEARLPFLVEEGRMIQIRHQQLGDEISLIRALGGGYDSQMRRSEP